MARKQGRTISELVREALVRTYGGRAPDERVATLRAIEGPWRGRKDIDDSSAFVRRLRRDTQPASPRGQVTGILLDSDVIIDALRGRRKTVDEIVAVEREGVHLGFYEPSAPR